MRESAVPTVEQVWQSNSECKFSDKFEASCGLLRYSNALVASTLVTKTYTKLKEDMQRQIYYEK